MQDVPIALSPEKVVEARQPRRKRGSRSAPVMIDFTGKAIALAQTLYAPATAQAELQIHGVDGKVAVYAIGPALEERVHQLHQKSSSGLVQTNF